MNNSYCGFRYWFLPAYALTLAAFLTGCGGFQTQPDPDPQHCADPNLCLSVSLRKDLTNTCLIAPEGEIKKQWYATNLTSSVTPKKGVIKFVREKYYQGGSWYGSDPEETVPLESGQTKPLGCQLGKESGTGESVLEYRIRIVCRGFENEECVAPISSARRSTLFTETVCPPDIPAIEDYTAGFSWLARKLRQTQSFPLNTSVIQKKFAPGMPITCDRNFLTLSGDRLQNFGDRCTVDADFDIQGTKAHLKIWVPEELQATRSVVGQKTNLSFVSSLAPYLTVMENHRVDRDNSGEVIGLSSDQLRVKVYIQNQNGNAACISYRYQ